MKAIFFISFISTCAVQLFCRKFATYREDTSVQCNKIPVWFVICWKCTALSPLNPFKVNAITEARNIHFLSDIPHISRSRSLQLQAITICHHNQHNKHLHFHKCYALSPHKNRTQYVSKMFIVYVSLVKNVALVLPFLFSGRLYWPSW